MRTARTRAGVAIGVLALLLTSACSAIQAESGQEVVFIGADLELSGEGAELGAIYRNALELRVEQVNRQGLLGDRRLELTVRDNRTDAGTAAANIAELAADDSVVAIVSGGCATCLLSAVDMINDVGIPTISLAAADAVAHPASDRRYVFKVGPNAADNARALLTEVNRAGATSVAVVASNDDYGSDGVSALTGAADRLGIDIVINERIEADQDAIAQLAETVVEYTPESELGQPQPGFPADTEPQAGPDAVVIWAFSPVADQFALALRNAGYQGDLFLDMAAANDLFFAGPTATALTGSTMIFTETFVIDDVIATSPAKASRKTWFNEYSARYGTYHAFSSFAADAVELVTVSVSRLDSTDRDAIRAAFERTQIDGLSGPLRITPDNHSGLTSLALITLVAGSDRWRMAS